MGNSPDTGASATAEPWWTPLVGDEERADQAVEPSAETDESRPVE